MSPTVWGWGGFSPSTWGWGAPPGEYFIRTEDDFVTVSDSARRIVDFVRRGGEGVDVFDDLYHSASFHRGYGEYVTVFDSARRIVNFIRYGKDFLDLTDSHGLSRGYIRTLGEHLTVTDFARRIVDFIRLGRDYVTLDDGHKIERGYFREIHEYTDIIDAWKRATNSARSAKEVLDLIEGVRARFIHLGREDLAWIIDPIEIVIDKVLPPGESYQFLLEDQLEHRAFNNIVLRFSNLQSKNCRFKIFQIIRSTLVGEESVIPILDEQVLPGATLEYAVPHPLCVGFSAHIIEITNLDIHYCPFLVSVFGWAARYTNFPAFLLE